MMIKRLFILGMLMAGTLAVSAQQSAVPFTDEYRTFWGGLAVGSNFSQIDGDGFAGYNKAGLNAGPVVYARFSNRVGASLEMLFSQKGSKMRRISESGYTGQYVERYDAKLNYVEIPLMLQLFTGGRFHFSLGGSYSYLVGAKETAEQLFPVNLDPDLYPFQKGDINYMFGAGYHLGKNWFFTGRFAYSVRTIRDPFLVPQGFGGGNQFNNLFTFRLMYLF